ncbi:hypothetical protein CMMCAS05_01420 [Clavibacter michiganensis subsp. michiganensis]|nr:hypothetical protein CMMCAS05_01420 [Clavibacter michiganensis subsp. michiganensis]
MVDVRGQLAREHVRARERQARAHAAHGRGAVRGVAHERDPPGRPPRRVHLPDRLVVEVVGPVEAVEHARGLPAGVGEAGAEPGPLLLDRAAARVPSRRGIHERGERGADRAVRVGPQADRPAAARDVPAPPVVVRGRARDGGVARLEPQRADHGLVAEHQAPGARPDAVGRHHEVEPLVGGPRERHRDAVALLADPRDAVVEAVLRGADGAVDEQLGEVAAQDLELRGRAARVAATGRELGDRAAVGPDEARADLARGRGADRVLDAHPPGDLAPGAAHVDVLAAAAELGRALHDHGVDAVAVQPDGERGAGDARAGDEDASCGHVVSFLDSQ